MSTDTVLHVADTHPACRVLGPGTRFIVWVQGCPLSCQGCVSPQWIPFTGGRQVAVDELARQVCETAVDGLTLSGGEPFAQAAALARLIIRIRARRDMSVMCYTGYTLRHLKNHGGHAEHTLLSQLDILVDGPYLRRSHGDLRWRGSANQRIHLLTGRHGPDIGGLDRSAGLQIEVSADDTLRWLGVPPVPGFLASFERACGLTPQLPPEKSPPEKSPPEKPRVPEPRRSGEPAA